MAEIPRRISLQDQVVELMRGGILAARWQGHLPPESELCHEFQVSRMTLRKALAQLASERWIELGGRGRFHRICRRRTKAAAATGHIVRLLTPFGFAEMSSSLHAIIKVISDRLAKNGYRLEIECHPGVFKRYQASELAQLNALPDTAGWILCYATPAIQRWFVECGRAAVVLGRLAEGVTLSAIYPDGEALARHAAGLFVARGHRRMVYLIAKVTSLGDRLASEVFAAEVKRLGSHAAIVHYEMEPSAVTKCLLDLLASRPRPTAFLVGAPEVAISVLCHLQAAGIRVPAEASVVAAWDDYHLEVTFPAITRYRVNAGRLGRRTAETIMDLIRHGTGKVRSIGVIPEFVAAGSLGSAGS